MNDKTSNDEELFLEIKKGNNYAIKLLFKKYYQNLCLFVFSIIEDFDVSKEIVSDLFVEIWEKREEIQINYKIKNYLFAASKNRAINYIKKKKLHTDPLEKFYGLEANGSSNPEEILIDKENRIRIENLVENLPNKRKIIFRMKRFEGFTIKEISEILSISIQTVRNQMVKAVKYLAEQYPKLK